jgi:hypothetical protein
MKQTKDVLHLALKFCSILLFPDLPFQEKVLPVKYNSRGDILDKRRVTDR